MKRWSGTRFHLFLVAAASLRGCCELDYAQDHAELGAALNGFSLNESGQLSTAIEKTGQAVDATYMSTTRLVRYVQLFLKVLCLSDTSCSFKSLSRIGQSR